MGDALDAAGGREADQPQVALVLVERPVGGAGEPLPLEVRDDVFPEPGRLLRLVPHHPERLPPFAEGEPGGSEPFGTVGVASELDPPVSGPGRVSGAGPFICAS